MKTIQKSCYFCEIHSTEFKFSYSLQDVDRFSILPTSPIEIYFIQKVGKFNIFPNLTQRSENNIFRYCNISSYRSYYAKMISLWVFFVFIATFCIGFTQTEKYQVKVISDNIYNRIIEFKAKKWEQKMKQKITVLLAKEYGQKNTFMSIILMTKITVDMWMWGPFHNRFSVIVSWENVWTNSCVQMYKVL